MGCRFKEAERRRQAVLDALNKFGPMSSRDVAEKSGIRRETIHNVVYGLLTNEEICRVSGRKLKALKLKTKSAEDTLQERNERALETLSSSDAETPQHSLASAGRVFTHKCSDFLQNGNRGRGQAARVYGRCYSVLETL